MLDRDICELMEPLRRHVTTESFMRLAMTCKTLYTAILGRLRTRVQECFKPPLAKQAIVMMKCVRNCSATETPFVYSQASNVIVRCTHCLYSFRTSSLPSNTWWMHPTHETMVRKIRNETGARHSLLYPL